MVEISRVRKIYVFGNPLVEEDSMPLKLLPKLKEQFPEVRFEIVDPNENFPPANEKDLVILDTVKGIKQPVILRFDQLAKIAETPVSPHDYDLMFHLQLMVKLGKIKTVQIIGVFSTEDTDCLEQVKVLVGDVLKRK